MVVKFAREMHHYIAPDPNTIRGPRPWVIARVQLWGESNFKSPFVCATSLQKITLTIVISALKGWVDTAITVRPDEAVRALVIVALAAVGGKLGRTCPLACANHRHSEAFTWNQRGITFSRVSVGDLRHFRRGRSAQWLQWSGRTSAAIGRWPPARSRLPPPARAPEAPRGVGSRMAGRPRSWSRGRPIWSVSKWHTFSSSHKTRPVYDRRIDSAGSSSRRAR
jgi:hypothetical protein